MTACSDIYHNTVLRTALRQNDLQYGYVPDMGDARLQRLTRPVAATDDKRILAGHGWFLKEDVNGLAVTAFHSGRSDDIASFRVCEPHALIWVVWRHS